MDNRKKSIKESKDIVQSYILTTARYDASIPEKRIMLRIVEMQQEQLNGQKLRGKIIANKSLFDTSYEFEIPYKAVLADAEDGNHKEIRKALIKLEERFFEYEDERIWKRIRLIERPIIKKHEQTFSFRLHEGIYEALLNFSKGYRRYELDTMFKFKSVYTMRFYELFSNQKSEVIWSMDNLKLMFRAEKQYKQTGDFIRWVIKPAQKELNEKSPYSFEFIPLKTGKSITAIKFIPVYVAKNINNELERKRLEKQINLSWSLDLGAVQYLKEQYKFSEIEIKNNIDVFRAAQRIIPDFILWLSEIKAKANRANNPKGYLINAMKRQVNPKKSKGDNEIFPANLRKTTFSKNDKETQRTTKRERGIQTVGALLDAVANKL